MKNSIDFNYEKNFQSLLEEVALLNQQFNTFLKSTSKILNTKSEKKEPNRIDVLCDLFGLSHFERNIILLCLGIEIDAAMGNLCAKWHNNNAYNYPSFQLALELFENASWDSLLPQSPLRRWNLIEFDTSYTLINKPIKIAESVLYYLLGNPILDQRLKMVVSKINKSKLYSNSIKILSNKILNYLKQNITETKAIHLAGEDRDTQYRVAQLICDHDNSPLYKLDLENINYYGIDNNKLIDLLERDAILQNCGYLIEYEALTSEKQSIAERLIERIPSFCFLVGNELPNLFQHSAHTFTVERPSAEEQLETWTKLINQNIDCDHTTLKEIVSQFSFDLGQIETTVTNLVTEYKEKNINKSTIWHHCRKQARKPLTGLAKIITPKANWQDLTLPADQLQMLRDIAAQIKHRHVVYNEWGFSKKNNRGLGLSVLFAGPSGTGKTLAAEVLANELNLDLYQIDLSNIISKYIGETEKHLKQIFDQAENSGAILLFDEADALFGKRSDVKDSHDRYANIEVSYLLQRIEAYSGLSILTTNLKSSIDEAFLRRIRFIIQFAFPDYYQRQQIWQNIFPQQLPFENLDVEKLARLNLAGGNVQSVALSAASIAAEKGNNLNMQHILHAAKNEYNKLEKILTDSEIKDW